MTIYTCATFVSSTFIWINSSLIGTVKTVFICIHIAECIVSSTFTIHLAFWFASVVLTVESTMIIINTVSILCTTALVGVLVTNGCGMFAVQSIVVTACE